VYSRQEWEVGDVQTERGGAQSVSTVMLSLQNIGRISQETHLLDINIANGSDEVEAAVVASV
jgi:hypothetical protein